MLNSGEDRRDANGEGEQFGKAVPSGKVGQFEKSDQLDLGDDDVRLPWLEGDDDDDLDQRSASSGQLIGFIVVGVVALAAIIGAIWWFQREKPDTALVADGETIEAPTTPYKTKPDNPGGNVVAGTGDTSYVVAEGQSRQVRIGSGDVAGVPPAAVATPAGPAATPSAAVPTSAPSTDMSGTGVQIGAYSNRESAEKGWTTLTQQHEVLSGMRYRIVEGRADIGTVYRLQAVPGDVAAASRLCATLKGAGLNCQVKR